jgi:hypothetical protein
MLYGRKDIDRKIFDLQRSLEATDDPLAIALIKLAKALNPKGIRYRKRPRNHANNASIEAPGG